MKRKENIGKIVGMCVCIMVIMTGLVSATELKTTENENDNSIEIEYEETECDCFSCDYKESGLGGDDYYDLAGDAEPYKDYGVVLSKGDSWGAAYYEIELECCPIDENCEFKIMIRECDVSSYGGDGADLYIKNQKTGNWERFIKDPGNNDDFRNFWSGHIKNGNDYVTDDCKVQLKAKADWNDHARISGVKVRYACKTFIPKIELTGEPDFGKVRKNTEHSKIFTLKSVGDGVAKGSVSVNGNKFWCGGGCGDFELSPGESKSINVCFKSSEKGTFTAVLKVDGSNCNDDSKTLKASAGGGTSKEKPFDKMYSNLIKNYPILYQLFQIFLKLS